ncbi:peptide chain release factor aRF-1 [Candidatus Woesearchaeota archaeon]|nr:peptide chain release factor aRF-1 [Candidatus Woesearchaeota archaeon]
MMIDQKKKREMKKIIDTLKSIKGRHTELVSVYVPADYNLIKIINHLSEEQGTAGNIKDKRTRQNVIDSLERIIRHLRLFKKTPPNGLAIFAGNISDNDSQINIQVFSVEPPTPLNIRMYRCDQIFVTEALEDMLKDKQTYGLIVIDRRDGTLGLLNGKSITELSSFSSNVPGKTTKGGQSQTRYARLRDEAAHNFFKKVGAAANDAFSQIAELKGILIGGPGPTKEDFISGDYLQTRIKEKIIGVKDLSYTEHFGLVELVDKSQDVFAQEGFVEEKKVMEKFFNALSAKGGNKAVYREEEVRKALEVGAVEVLLLSEDLDDAKIEELEKKAEMIGAEVKIISLETNEGQQLKFFGGVAAILRFNI